MDSSKYVLPGIKYFCGRVNIIEIKSPAIERRYLKKKGKHAIGSSFPPLMAGRDKSKWGRKSIKCI